MVALDEYISGTIAQGDEGSRLLAEIFAPTLKLSSRVRPISSGMNNIATLDVEKNREVLVHSRGGNPIIGDLFDYGFSVVEDLVNDSRIAGAEPIGLADIIEMPEFNRDDLKKVAEGIRAGAEKYHLPILNGEYAIHGYRVNSKANVSATMMSLRIPASDDHSGTFTRNTLRGQTVYAFFRTDGKPIYINSDGVGTKTELYELANLHHLAVEDFMAMTMDDAVKICAKVKAISGVIETRGIIPVDSIVAHAKLLAEKMGIVSAMHHEEVAKRIKGYKSEWPTYNVAGSVVSTIDEERLRSLPVPKIGDRIVAVYNLANPRSNGITSRRKDLREVFGEDGYKTGRGAEMLDYLTQPSIIFYPFATEAFDSRLASGFFHMSGGAYEGKFARPLTKHNLLGDIDRPLAIRDMREMFFIERAGADPEVCYRKYPMNYDAFVTTNDPSAIYELALSMGLRTKNIGSIKAPQDGKTGLKLIAWNEQEVYLPGK